MRRLAVMALVAIVLAGCGSRSSRPPSSAEAKLGPSTTLIDLEHPNRKRNLFSLFNTDQGVPRLVLLVSPT